MARVIGPLLSLGARQTVGGALTYSNWKGVDTVRLKSNPSNPQTETQMHNRALFSVGGKISKRVDPEESEASYLRTVTPAQQSYLSAFIREMMGTNYVNIEAAISDYEDVANATVAGYFDTAAAAAGIESVDLDGTANTQVSAGAALWAAYAASYRLGSPNAQTVVTSAAEADVEAYTLALTGVTV